MSDILSRLYAAKAQASAADERRESYEQVVERGLARRAERRDFAAALRPPEGIALIAEIKHASPSLGRIVPDFDPAKIAAIYERAHVDAISVLTEASEFLGELAYLDVVRGHASAPILRKDFLSTPYEIAQAAAYGADAVLLIVAGLGDAELRELLAQAERFDLAALVEVHDEDETRRAVAAGAPIVGINNRDLRTFKVDLATTERLVALIPAGTTVVSESGFHSPGEVERIRACGVRAFLIGESMMRSGDPLAHAAALRGRS